MIQKVTKSKLSEKRKQWIGTRTTNLLGTTLNYNVAAQIRYTKALVDLYRGVAAKVEKEVVKLFRTHTAKKFLKKQKIIAARDDTIASQAKILTNAINEKFQKLFDDLSRPLAENMVADATKSSAVNLGSSLKVLSGGLTLNTKSISSGLKEIIKSVTNENASLIVSTGGKYLDQVQQLVMRSITTSNGLDYLVPRMKQIAFKTERHARLVALDQTRKAYNQINKQRMMDLGHKKFKWLHSGGGLEPRPSHIAMSGNIYSFDDLPQINKDNPKESPEYGIPGQAINCKCVMQPIIELEDGSEV